MESLPLSELLWALFDEHSDALFVKDRQGVYLLCNQAAARMVGRRPEDFLGNDDTAIFDADSAAVVMNRDRRVLASGRAETEEEVLSANGETRIYLATKSPYRNSQGEVVAVLGISRDITNLRRAQDSLAVNQLKLEELERQALGDRARTEGLLRLVLDAIPVGVQVMDRQGDVVLTNPAARRIWGHIIGPAQERYASVQASWHDSGAPVEKAQWASQRALNHGEVSRNEKIDIEAFDGRKRTILNSGAPIHDLDHKILGAVIINEDITERLQLEQQFLQAQKMEAVGHLAAGAAHDFNNLLTVISGCAELLAAELPADDPQYELVTPIQEAARKAATLTRQLLAFSRQSVMEPQELDLNQLVDDNQKMLRRLIGEDIQLIFEPDSDPCWVRVDPGQFDQVLINLSINARDAMQGGGQLHLATRRMGQEACLEVRDSGCGMSKEVMEHIFEPFFTTKVRGKGTGLGLSTVYGIVRQSGGRIEVESHPGQGTQFRIWLPITDAAEASRQVPLDQRPAKGGPGSILLVEDQEELRNTLVLALTRAGYTTMCAVNGADALRIWEENGTSERFDLIITDVVMPVMGGRQLVEQLQQRRPGLKVLYISGYHSDMVLHHGVMQSEVHLLQKPFSMQQLLATVESILGHPG